MVTEAQAEKLKSLATSKEEHIRLGGALVATKLITDQIQERLASGKLSEEGTTHYQQFEQLVAEVQLCVMEVTSGKNRNELLEFLDSFDDELTAGA